MARCKMRKFLGLVSILCFLTLLLQGATLQKGEKKGEKKEWPKVGSVVKYQGVDWYVRGIGSKPFEYTATGESLALWIEDTSSAITLVPKKGQIVRCDPTVPMLYVDKIPDKYLSRNDYFKQHAKDKVWMLLEYKRK